MDTRNVKKAFGPLKKYRVKVVLAPIFKLVEAVTELIVPILVSAIIDNGLDPDSARYGDWGYVITLACIMFGLAILGFSVTMITQYLAARVSSDYSYDLKKVLYERIHLLSPKQLDDYGRNKALNLVNNDAFLVQNGVQMLMRLIVRAPFLILGSIIASFLVNPLAGCVVLGALALSGAVIGIVVSCTPKQYAKLQHELDIISSRGEDGIVGARVVRSFNKEGKEREEFRSASERYRKQALLISRINALINPMTFALINAAILLIFYLGNFHSDSTSLSVGNIVALMNYLTTSLAALIMFTRLITSVSKAFTSKKRIDDFLSIEPDIVSGDRVFRGEIQNGEPYFEFKGASMNFGGENYALKDINLTIKKGESVGIIGGTGSGKSTLLNLMERFFDLSEGELLFRGYPIKESKLEDVRSSIALVSQKKQLFRGSIRSNLLLGRKDATEEEMIQALKDSLAYEFVSRYKDGLDHEVEEGGQNFSGGQKQRLLIARALLSSRPILFLDDATSALDYKSDLMVRQNIAKKQGLTLVMVSQRATSIKDCDDIYVLDAGRVVGEGSHEQLLASCPIYQEIYETQVKTK